MLEVETNFHGRDLQQQEGIPLEYVMGSGEEYFRVVHLKLIQILRINTMLEAIVKIHLPQLQPVLHSI